MAHIKYPILGDPVYGGRLRVPADIGLDFARKLREFKRQALHASCLSFKHPGSEQNLSFGAAIPEDFQTMLDTLRGHSNGV